MSDVYSLVYVTAGSEEEARRLAESGVAERLAACANILSGTTSIYWWEGKLEKGREALVIFKTRTDLVERLTAHVKALHAFEVPCIVAVPVTGGLPEFLEWIGKETA